MVLIRKDAISVDWFRWNDTANHILKSHLFGNIFANRAMHSICLPFGWALNALIGKQAGEALWPAFRLIFMHKQKGGQLLPPIRPFLGWPSLSSFHLSGMRQVAWPRGQYLVLVGLSVRFPHFLLAPSSSPLTLPLSLSITENLGLALGILMPGKSFSSCANTTPFGLPVDINLHLCTLGWFEGCLRSFKRCIAPSIGLPIANVS